MTTHLSTSPAATKKLAAKLAKEMPHGGFICLNGDLGSGKTVFTKGFARELGVKEQEVKSPTYTLVREYALGGKKLYHFDFYRIEQLDDLITHDLEEIFTRKNTWIIIEWAERVAELLPARRVDVHFATTGENQRKIRIERY